MRRTLGILRVSNRGQGEAGTYGERSPEFEQRATALSCCRCRGYRPCADKREVSVDAHREAEHDSMNHGQRGCGAHRNSSARSSEQRQCLASCEQPGGVEMKLSEGNGAEWGGA